MAGMNTYTYISKNEEDTLRFAEHIGQKLSKGVFIALYGELGAGKTTFVKGLAKGLGIRENILSPTFTLMREYGGENKLYHFDAYRLTGEDDALETGLEDYIVTDGVTVAEWAQNIAALLPGERIDIEIARGVRAEERVLRITCAHRYKKGIEAALSC